MQKQSQLDRVVKPVTGARRKPAGDSAFTDRLFAVLVVATAAAILVGYISFTHDLGNPYLNVIGAAIIGGLLGFFFGPRMAYFFTWV